MSKAVQVTILATLTFPHPGVHILLHVGIVGLTLVNASPIHESVFTNFKQVFWPGTPAQQYSSKLKPTNTEEQGTPSISSAFDETTATEVEIEPLKLALSTCESVHGEQCNPPYQNRLSNIILINVRRKCIESISTTYATRYVALSYVWGAAGRGSEPLVLTWANFKVLQETRSLEQVSLPATIQDAMKFCRKMGEEYLWVDRLCIIQDQPETKHQNIRNMATIYGSAVFTIVAAAGKDDTSGLPTSLWSHGPRSTTDFAVDVGKSVWNERAWTYQEYVLSPRCLFFTDGKIYLQWALLWQHSGSFRWRKGADHPSWSWLAWEGQIAFPRFQQFEDVVHFFYNNPALGLVPVKAADSHSSIVLDAQKHAQLLLSQGLKHSPCSLIFTTYVARIQLSPEDLRGFYSAINIRDLTGSVAGHLWLDRTADELECSSADQFYEMALVASGTQKSVSNYSSTERTKMHVMFLSNKDGIGSEVNRVGVGWIYRYRWEQMHPIVQTIVLN